MRTILAGLLVALFSLSGCAYQAAVDAALAEGAKAREAAAVTKLNASRYSLCASDYDVVVRQAAGDPSLGIGIRALCGGF